MDVKNTTTYPDINRAKAVNNGLSTLSQNGQVGGSWLIPQ